MKLSEQMAAKKAAKQKRLLQQAEKKQPNNVTQPLLVALNDLMYKLKSNQLTVGDTYNILLLFQHTYFIQSVAKELQWNWIGLQYINKIKLSIKRILNNIVDKHCYIINNIYHANPKDKLTIYKQTRVKLLWFIARTYNKTAQIFKMTFKQRGYKQKVAKYMIYAKEMLDMDLLISEPKISKFIHQ